MSFSDEDLELIDEVLGEDGEDALETEIFTTGEVAALLAAIRSQPIPITDEMVERGARAIFPNLPDPPGPHTPNSAIGKALAMSRAALQAALQHLRPARAIRGDRRMQIHEARGANS